MRVFVTGATGFIGFAIIQELLKAGHQVTGLARSEAAEKKLTAIGARAHRGTIQDLSALRQGAAGAEGVIHTAFFHALSHMSLQTRLYVLLGGLPPGIVSRFGQVAVEADRDAIETLASVLKGNDRALVAAFPTLALRPGHTAIETDPTDPAAPGGPRGETEKTIRALAASGVRSSSIRLPPMVHGSGDRAGLLPQLFRNARRKGFSAYVDQGSNRWPAVHVLDAAHLFCQALEKGIAGGTYHAVGEGGVSFKEVAQALGERAKVAAVSKPRSEASKVFSFLAPFVSVDNPVSSELTQAQLDWRPTRTGIIDDIKRPSYFPP